MNGFARSIVTIAAATALAATAVATSIGTSTCSIARGARCRPVAGRAPVTRPATMVSRGPAPRQVMITRVPPAVRCPG